MAFPQPANLPTAILLTPECEAGGCHIAGDQYSMVHCRACGGWFSSKHIATEEVVRLVQTTLRLLRGLAFFQGICFRCWQERQRSN